MSAKPATVPVWAEDANYPAGAEPEAGTPTKVDPDREDIGWRPNEHPTAQGDNYRRNLVGEWCQYVNDGAFTGDHSIDGDLGVTGSVDVDTDLNVDGDSTFVGETYHGNRTLAVFPRGYMISGTNIVSVASSALRNAILANGVWYVDLSAEFGLKKGDRIKSVRIKATSGLEPTFELWEQVDDAAGSRTFVQTGTVLGDTVVTLTDNTDGGHYLGADGEMGLLSITADNSNVNLFSLSITFDRPDPATL